MPNLSPFVPAPVDMALQQAASLIASSPQLSSMVDALLAEGMPLEEAISQVAAAADLPLSATPGPTPGMVRPVGQVDRSSEPTGREVPFAAG